MSKRYVVELRSPGGYPAMIPTEGDSPGEAAIRVSGGWTVLAVYELVERREAALSAMRADRDQAAHEPNGGVIDPHVVTPLPALFYVDGERAVRVDLARSPSLAARDFVLLRAVLGEAVRLSQRNLPSGERDRSTLTFGEGGVSRVGSNP